MSLSPFDSALYARLFGDAEVAALFSDSAEVRAMMLVLGTLAGVQGRAGVIPEASGAFLDRAMREGLIDAGALAEATGRNGVTVPGLVAALRISVQAPEHAQYLHWGATSQDIQDTGLMLRLRRVLEVMEGRLAQVLSALADLAAAHAETPQAARTYGQVAVPSGFGALVATWGAPLLEHHRDLGDLRARALAVSLSGAAGTGTMIGPDPAAIRAGVARALDLPDPGTSWHAERHRIQRIAAWMTGCATAAGKIGEDLLRLSRSEVAELGFAASGASSTMPQKQNPVAASTLVALHRFSVAQQSALMSAPHGEARDGAAWFTEWLALPQLIAASGKALAVLAELIPALVVDADAMRARVEDPLGLIHAETLSFALAAVLPRAEAQAVVKSLAAKALATGTPLPDLIRAAHPDAALPDLAPEATMGAAPAEARAFAKAVRAHLT